MDLLISEGNIFENGVSMANHVSVRIGKPNDIESIVKFNQAMALETEQKNLSLPLLTKGVKAVFENPEHGFYVVAEIDNEVIGCLLVTYEWSDWRCGLFWWLQSLYVAPEYRQQGVFHQLYKFVKEKAVNDSNICGFRLYVEKDNYVAQSSYKKVGMEESGYKIYEEMLW